LISPQKKFSLNGSKRGFISASYDEHEQYSTAIVTDPELKTDELVLRLDPVAVIGGHVRMRMANPVRHAQVTLYMEDHRGGMNRVSRLLTSTSDDVGYFDFSSLIPGTYFVFGQRDAVVCGACPPRQQARVRDILGLSPALDASLSEHLLQPARRKRRARRRLW